MIRSCVQSRWIFAPNTNTYNNNKSTLYLYFAYDSWVHTYLISMALQSSIFSSENISVRFIPIGLPQNYSTIIEWAIDYTSIVINAHSIHATIETNICNVEHIVVNWVQYRNSFCSSQRFNSSQRSNQVSNIFESPQRKMQLEVDGTWAHRDGWRLEPEGCRSERWWFASIHSGMSQLVLPSNPKPNKSCRSNDKHALTTSLVIKLLFSQIEFHNLLQLTSNKNIIAIRKLFKILQRYSKNISNCFCNFLGPLSFDVTSCSNNSFQMTRKLCL